MSDSFHHRSNFQTKRKSHKIPGKGKPSSNSKQFGRIGPSHNPNDRKFGHTNEFRDIGIAQRKASSKQKRKLHRSKLIDSKLKYNNKLSGGTPKIIALIALSPYSNINKIKKHLLLHCGCNDGNKNENEIIECQSKIGNKKSNYIIYSYSNRNDTFSILDICKIADIILLVCSPKPEKDLNNSSWNDSILGLDSKSKLFCSLIKSIGGGSSTTIYGLYQAKYYKNLSNLNKNNKFQQCKLDPLIKNTFLKYLQFEFGNSNSNQKNIRIFNCYDCIQLFRFMNECKNYNDFNILNCEWKQKRPHLLIQKLYYKNDANNILIVDGYLRGTKKLNINRPIHITGYGDYLIHKIHGLVPQNTPKNENENENDLIMNFINDIIITNSNQNDEKKMDEFDNKYDSIQLIGANNYTQDNLQKLGNISSLDMNEFDQTIITEKELIQIENERIKRIEKEKLEQKGLTDYNLDWIDDNDNDNDNEMDIDMDDLNKQKEFEKEEFLFPDEVEIEANIRAKDKFAQYRGMKQFYKTKWDKFELLPIEYSQIANIKDWNKAIKMTKLNNIINNNENENENNNGEIECGKRIRIYIKNISSNIYNQLFTDFKLNKPLIIWSLLEHENKISVCHYLIQKYKNYEKPIQGLKTYIFDVGFRRFKSKPIFSDNSRGNKHCVQKFINDNQFVVASIYSEITYPPIGVLMFNNENNNIQLCCKGNLLSVNAHRLLIKRKILTGAAYRVQGRRAVIRYMFYNSDDVRYFKPIDLWTKHGLKGRIEEPIGDKGAMKCFFNGNVKQNDTICLSLYKRVFPFKDNALFQNQ